MSNNFTPIVTTGLSGSQRRLLVVALYIGTASPILWRNFTTFNLGGAGCLDWFLLLSTLLCTLYPIIDFWNAVIGICVKHFGNAEKSIYPYFNAKDPLPELKVTSRTALMMLMRNEDPNPIFDRLSAIYESLSRTGRLQHFRFVLLSDTSRPEVIRMEEEGFARIKETLDVGTFGPAWYRRRPENIGYKAGNVYDYLENDADGDEFFVSLDSDSVMGGDLLVRIVSSMEKHPQIGLLQTTFSGIPTVSAFARMTQFSQRHSVHTINMGLSWWANDCAVYWGHNAIIRTKAFRDNCKLPILSARPPFGGHILSHDIIESIFLQRAGYEVRLIPVETESYESFPPTLIDHLRRQLRWCQGSMQYWFLLTEPGLQLISRFQIFQQILVDLGPATWVLMGFGVIAKSLLNQSSQNRVDKVDLTPQIAIFCLKALPEFIGAFYSIMNASRRYGDTLRCIISAVLELIFITLIGSTLAISIVGLIFSSFLGGSSTWDGQNRDQLGLSWRSTFRVLWPHTVIGVCLTSLIIARGNTSIPGAAPLAAGLTLCVPIAVLTASPWLSRTVTRLRLFMIPQESLLPHVLSSVVAPEIISMAKAHTLSKGDPGRRSRKAIRRGSFAISSLSSLTQHKAMVESL
ncbi:hypothetical protein NX059_006387 [Plenodomus lindquistii]|nr:hypothetical protein NX059_006387 [Plenodomus lindquistii]